MSRIHEAVKKAAQDRKVEAGSDWANAEDILSMSSAMLLTAHAEIQPKQTERTTQLLQCATEEWSPDERKMLFSHDSLDPFAREQFRSLRTKFGQLREDRPVSVVAVVSALSGEGKTFVAANMAHAFAVQREQRVLLVDCDLRRGGLSKLVGARSRPGLSDYLMGDAELESVLQAGFDGRLHLIPSGRPMREPGDLIGRSRFPKLMAHLRTMFDWIVIDTPPVIQFADASLIADECDGVLFVVCSGVTPVQLAKRALRSFNKMSILGAVLNRADEIETASKYYAYGEKAALVSR